MRMIFATLLLAAPFAFAEVIPPGETPTMALSDNSITLRIDNQTKKILQTSSPPDMIWITVDTGGIAILIAQIYDNNLHACRGTFRPADSRLIAGTGFITGFTGQFHILIPAPCVIKNDRRSINLSVSVYNKTTKRWFGNTFCPTQSLKQ